MTTDLMSQLQASLVRCRAEKLSTIPTENLALPEWPGDPACRPEYLTLFAGMCEDTPPHVTLYLPPLFGQQGRYLDLEPIEARTLAEVLTAIANAIDRVIPHVEPDPTPSP